MLDGSWIFMAALGQSLENWRSELHLVKEHEVFDSLVVSIEAETVRDIIQQRRTNGLAGAHMFSRHKNHRRQPICCAKRKYAECKEASDRWDLTAGRKGRKFLVMDVIKTRIGAHDTR
ncbi:hypothetical protein SBDP1_1070007 [Syntrophobacter sp. SbD1]|nr:hypothetical protein SBDP1_1070007 [Syntrophobacter sp. SbD1]